MKNILLVLSIVALTGCATQTFNIQKAGVEQPTQEIMHHFFIGGIGQSKSVDAVSVCGSADNVARVETHLSFLNGLLSSLTVGIYSPRTAKVYCNN